MVAKKKTKEYDLSQPLDEVDENATIATLIEYLQEKILKPQNLILN